MKIKKYIIAAVTAVASSLSGSAQLPAGSWQILPPFTPPAMQVVETPERVYFVSGGSLFATDKESLESYPLTSDSGLSGHSVKSLSYNPDSGYLLIAYDGGDIDLLSDDGTIVSLPDIADASLSPKTINSVAFSGDNIYAATPYGLVKFSASKQAVADYGRYGRSVDAVTVAGGKVIISAGDSLMAVSEASRINSISDFSLLGAWSKASSLTALSPTILLAAHPGRVATYTIAPGWVEGVESINVAGECSHLSRLDDGSVITSSGSQLIVVSPEGHISTLPLPAQLQDNIIGGNSTSSLWGLNSAGLINMVSSSGGWSVAMDRFIPHSLAVSEAAFFIPGASDERIYITNLGPTVYRMGISGWTDGRNVNQQAALISGSEIKSITLSQPLNAPTRLAENPADPSTVFMATGNSGIHKVTAGKDMGTYNGSNAPLSDTWGAAVYDVAFDRDGNLWAGGGGLENDRSIMILPAAKVALNPSEIKTTDWMVPYIPDHSWGMDMRIFHTTQSPVTFAFDVADSKLLLAYHNNSTPSQFTDDRILSWDSFTDQDGKSFTPHRCTAIAEDANGAVWIGTSSGVFVINNPADAVNPAMTVRRLKMSHDDGTNLADYFAETDIVLDIAVDGANRKWIATAASGLYLLNADGTEILRHFTSSNSPLPDDRVNAVYADPLSNTVYVATPLYVMAYGSDASRPAADYSSIRVYPNPLTPEHTGPVTIDSLTDGSLVKIADSSGSVVWQGRAEGGMVQWPAQNSSGARVSSGVYFVLPSPSSSDSSVSSVAAKIVVIN